MNPTVNPPAFPVGLEIAKRFDPGHPSPLQPGELTAIASGMTLRDWFAGQALAAMTVAPDYSKGPCNSAMAERAYLIAEHMIAERQR